MGLFRLIVGLTLLGLLLLFSLQNTEVVQVDFVVWSFSVPRIVLLFLVFAAGILVDWILQRRPGVSKDEDRDDTSAEPHS